MNIIEKILKYLFIFSFFILVISFLIFPVTDLDIWMHLVSGKYILENFKIPQSEFYSYTASGKPWIDHEWLSQAIFYIFYQASSYYGLILLRIIIFLLIFSVFFVILNKKTNYFFATAISFITLLVSHDRFYLRPEVFTLLFTISYIYVLEQYCLKPTKLIYLLPILQILWVNLHGYFLLGIIVPLLFLIGQFFEKKDNSSNLFLLALLLVLASFINPYTYKGAIYPFSTLFSSLTPEWRSVLKDISELKSPFLRGSPTLFWFKFLITVSIFSFLLSLWARTLKVSRLIIYLLFLILGFTVKRHQTLFAFVVGLITVYNLQEIYSTGRLSLKGLMAKILKITKVPPIYLRLTCLFLFIVYFFTFTVQIVTNRFYLKERILKTFDLGLTPELFPEKAVDFLIENNFKGHIFNDMIGGSYLVWRYYPKRKVFLDGRTEVYGPEVFKDYLLAFRQPQFLNDVVQKYGIDHILINYSLGGRGQLAKYLLDSKDWALVYFDQTALIFIKNAPENKNFINKFLVNLDSLNNPRHFFWTNISKDYIHKKWVKDELFPYGFLKVGYLLCDLGYPKLAEIAFQKALELNNNFDLPYGGLGNVYHQQKLYSQALQFYIQALAKNSNSSETYYNLARIYEKQNLISQAENYYKKSLGLNPYDMWCRYDLGFLYFNQKKFNLAVRQLKKAVKLNPAFGEAYRVLGASLANSGEPRLAKINFQKAITLLPNDKQLHFNLGLLLEGIGKFNASINEFQEVLRLNPEDLEARHYLAVSYLSAGLVLKAQEQWLIIKKQDPENKMAKEYLKKLERLGYEYALN